MSANLEARARALAGRVAQRLEAPAATADNAGEIAELRDGLRKVLARLNAIEARLPAPSVSEARQPASNVPAINKPTMAVNASNAPFTPLRTLPIYTQPLPAHPSQERLNIGPAVTELVDYFENIKRCDFEAGDKPCDNCAMCTARGF